MNNYFLHVTLFFVCERLKAEYTFSMFNKYIAMMLSGALIIGLSPIVAKGVDISPTLIAFYRFFFGMFSLALLIIARRLKPDLTQLKKALPYIIGAGFFFAYDLWNWHRSVILVGAGTGTLLANTQVFYLVIISRFVLKEVPRWYFYPAMLGAITGLGMVTIPYINFELLDNNAMGIIYGLVTGLTYALVTLFMKKANEVYIKDQVWPIFTVTIVAAISAAIFCIMEDVSFPIQGHNLKMMLVYGGLIHFSGWLLITGSITKISVAVTSILLLTQPVFATYMGNLIYGEKLNTLQIIGLVITLISIYVASHAKKQRPS
jgi:drug/metabolite transporter (DMT)-like permease